MYTAIEIALVAVSFFIGLLSIIQYMNVPTYHFGDIDVTKEDLKGVDVQSEAAHIISMLTAGVAWFNFLTEMWKIAKYKYDSRITAIHYLFLIGLSTSTTILVADKFQDGGNVDFGPFQFEVGSITMGPAFIISDISVLVFSVVGFGFAAKIVNDEK